MNNHKTNGPNLSVVDPVEPEAHPDSVNARFADNLILQREVIMSEWVQKLRCDATIPTGTPTITALKDHLPQLLDNLIDTLRRYGSEAVTVQSEKDGEEHRAARRQQGYDLPEVLRELKHLRAVLIYHLGVFEDLNEDLGRAAKLFISLTLHRFIDEMGIDASEQPVAKDS